MVKGLNNVIDRNKYSTPCAERSNMRHRPLGIGVQGLADLFFMFRTTFGEPLSKRLNKDIFEALYYYAVRASMLIAKEVGPYSTFVGSPMSKGVFQFDMWSVTPDSGRFDWAALKTDVITHGIRNSLLIALMPTASTSQLLGNSECIEPYSSNVFARSTVAGTFQVVNKYLMEDLIKLDLWSEELCNAMIANNGSIQAIDGIPDGIKRLYKTAWEMDMKDILDMSADRGAYVCQSQSLNLFKEMPVDSAAMTGQRERLRRMYYYAWKIGLKTGQYYLRTRPAKDPIKVTLNVNNEKKRLGAPAGKLINRPDGSTLICTDSVCIMCE
jgi:ribonucleoside-diphosphate reductase alpha chain